MFLAISNPFGPVWTLSDHFKQKWFFVEKHLCQTLLCPYRATNWFFLKWSESVQMGPIGSQVVKNIWRHPAVWPQRRLAQCRALGRPSRPSTTCDPVGRRPRTNLSLVSHCILGVSDTLSDSIQCLNFAKKRFIQYMIQYCFTQDSIQNIIQFKK